MKILVKHDGFSYNYNHCLKEIILPLFLIMNKKDLLYKHMNIEIYCNGDITLIWNEMLKSIFPRYSFEDKKNEDYDIIINYAWPMTTDIDSSVTRKDIELFIEYLEKTIKIPENFQEYDIVLIKRSQLSREYNYDEEIRSKLTKKYVNNKHIRYIDNNEEIYNSLIIEFPEKKILNIDIKDLKFEERFHLFRNTDIIIGIHGAAMANCLFFRENKMIIEYLNKNLFDKGFTRQICEKKERIIYIYGIYNGNIDNKIIVDDIDLVKVIDDFYKNNINVEIKVGCRVR